MKLSIVFSFRNEENNIKELVQRTSSAISSVEDCDYELIFVNDASTDGSFSLLSELKLSYPIKIINMSRNFGVTPCVLAGFANACGDAVVYMDSDLQDPPELIPKMVEKFREGYDVVHTTRTHREGESPLKMWITRRAYDVINFFSDIELPQNTGDFKLLSKRVVGHILSIDDVDPYMRGTSIWVGYKQYFIKYTRKARFAGETHMPLFGKGPVKEFLRGLTSYSAGPLYLSFFAGVISVIGACMLSIVLIFAKVFGYAAPGVTTTSLLVIFFGGAVLMTQGVLGLYIARIYNQTKGRPKYIIESIVD